MSTHFLLFLFLVSLSNCTSQTPSPKSPTPYDFEKPGRLVKLDKELDEISGITWYSKDTLAAVQDEEGKLYLLSAISGQILDSWKFNEDGDYEDLCLAGNQIYVVRSDGKLFSMDKQNRSSHDVTHFKTDLGEKNNIEGLCYDLKQNRLLMACKDEPNISGKSLHKFTRTVYSFELDDKKLNEAAVFTINEDSLIAHVHRKYGDRLGNRFRPSGIAIHPLSGQIYVISSVNGILAVFDAKSKLVDAIRLPARYFAQVESICFDPQGGLFLASEAAGREAIMAYYPMK